MLRLQILVFISRRNDISMAKKKPGSRQNSNGDSASERQNKAAAVRTFLSSNPSAKGKEVVAALSQQGIRISPNYVSLIKSKSLAKKSSRRDGKPTLAGNEELKGALDFIKACHFDFKAAHHYLGLIEKV